MDEDTVHKANDQLIAAQQVLIDAQAAAVTAVTVLNAERTANLVAITKDAQDKIAAVQKTAEEAMRVENDRADGVVRQANVDRDKAAVTVQATIDAAAKAVQDATAAKLSVDSAAKLNDLGIARSQTADLVRQMGSQKTPEDAIAYDAQLRLAQEAARRAEMDYNAALAAIQTDHLMALVTKS